MRKTLILLVMLFVMAVMIGCGKKAGGQAGVTGTLDEIMDGLYESAELDPDFRESMEYFERSPIEPDSAEYMIGTSELDYVEALYSAPMMSSVAYQCILIRMGEGADMEAAKETVLASADPRKWICVEAESTIVESRGDVLLFVMADEETAAALQTSFLNLE